MGAVLRVGNSLIACSKNLSFLTMHSLWPDAISYPVSDQHGKSTLTQGHTDIRVTSQNEGRSHQRILARDK